MAATNLYLSRALSFDDLVRTLSRYNLFDFVSILLLLFLVSLSGQKASNDRLYFDKTLMHLEHVFRFLCVKYLLYIIIIFGSFFLFLLTTLGQLNL